MCKVLEENGPEAVKTTLANQPASHKLRTNLRPVETICEDINRILSQLQNPTSEQAVLNPETQTTVAEPSSPLKQKDDNESAGGVEIEMKDVTESEPTKDSKKPTETQPDPAIESKPQSNDPVSTDVEASQAGQASSPGITANDVVMEDITSDDDTKTDGPGVIVLDD